MLKVLIIRYLLVVLNAYMMSTSWMYMLGVTQPVTILVTVGSHVELALFTGDTQGVHCEYLLVDTVDGMGGIE